MPAAAKKSPPARATAAAGSPSRKPFDRKFGEDRIGTLPTTPGVYLFRDGGDRVIYVGKAKNLRRRLQGYRNASRKRAHRKMRTLVREAASLEIRQVETEQRALLVENELIRSLHPPFNVDGAYAFLYPAIGLGREGSRTSLAFSTEPEAWEGLQLCWYGVFRSRPRALEGFEALSELLSLLGHREPRNRLPTREPVRGARLVVLRQLPTGLRPELERFLAGDDPGLLATLARTLLGKPRARREADRVEAHLHIARAFFEADCSRLREVLQALRREGTYVHRDERDALFIQARS